MEDEERNIDQESVGKTEQNYEEELIAIIRQDLPEDELRSKLEQYHENDIAGALEKLTPEERKRLYEVLGEEFTSDIFTYLENPDEYIKELDLKKVAEIIENMDSDDAVEIIEEMDDSMKAELSELLTEETKEDIRLIRSYEDDEIGSKMTTNFVTVRNTMSIKEAMRALIKQAEDNDNITTIYALDENDKYYGALELKDLIIARQGDDINTLISTAYPYVTDHEAVSDCIDRIREYAEDSIPVLDADKNLLGIITAQDIVEVVDDEMGEDYARLAGLTAEEDLHENLFDSMKKRLPWLAVLLVLGIVVSSVVGIFENVVAQISLVVCFQSLILDMAGNVGTQSLAVTIRVLVDENVKGSQKLLLVLKEMRVGLANGALLGIITFALVGVYIAALKGYGWMYAFSISGCVGVALMVTMVFASLLGTVVPMIFHKMKIDPAVASGPLITTVNDFIAIITYYGLVWILLINVLKITS